MKEQQSNASPLLVTGGAGFIGCNLADRLLDQGYRVRIFDNLSRPGVQGNLAWLKERHGDRVECRIADMRDRQSVREAVQGVAGVYHFAAQVAVTTSLEDPGLDFETNLAGTFHLLDALRRQDSPAPLVFTSTNKVYGDLAGVELVREERRYRPLAEGIDRFGCDERFGLSLHTPYGCSKGAADQYVLDFSRSYGLPAMVFRMSCIYGPRQRGTEDQGWVAHFALQLLRGQPITIYGDGRQVRDVLFVSDLVDALALAREQMGSLQGRAFNMGGGPANAVSLLEVIELLREECGVEGEIRFGPQRCGDQLYYVADTSAFRQATGWSPQVNWRSGIARLVQWLNQQEIVPAAIN